MMFDAGVILLLIVGFFLFYLGFFILYKNPKSPVNRTFFIFNLSVLLWMFVAYFQDETFGWMDRSVFLKLDFSFGMFMAFSFLFFCMALAGMGIVRKRMTTPILFLIPVLFSGLIFFTPFLLSGFADDVAGTIVPILGPLWPAYEAVIILVLLSGIAILVKYYRLASPKDRGQYLYFFLGIALTASALLYTNVFLSDDSPYFISYYRLGIFSSLFLVLLPGYSILRYRLLSGRLLTVELLSLVILLIAFVQIFTSETAFYLMTRIAFFVALSFVVGLLVRSTNTETRRKEELQEISDSLAKANERLKELDNTKTEFISIASHQLRTPLTAIKGYLSLLLEGSYGEISTEVTDVLEKINLVNRNLVQLVEDLLNVSRIDAGRIRYAYEPIRIEALASEQTDMFMPMARDKGIGLSLHLPEEPLPELMLDAGKIREAVSNLVDNALKYTEKGSVAVSVESSRGDAVRIVVADTGIGFHSEDGEKLFGKFVRTQETTKIYVSGTGLGLYVGKSFVEAHGGKMWAESEGVGMGSRFIIELPFENPRAVAGEGSVKKIKMG